MSRSIFVKCCLLFFVLGFLASCASVDSLNSALRDALASDGINYRYLPLDDNSYNRRHKLPAGKLNLKTITIHNTAGKMSAESERNRLNARRDNVSVSFHFAVDENEVVQILPMRSRAWHAGDGAKGEGNNTSLSIEICRSLLDGEKENLYRSAELNAAILAARLLDMYSLDISALRKHQDWSGKYCPHKILTENRWDNFRNKVASFMKNAKPSEKSLKVESSVLEFDNGKAVFVNKFGKRFYSVDEFSKDLASRGVGGIRTSTRFSQWRKDLTKALVSLRSAGIDVLEFTSPPEKNYRLK